MVQQTTVPAEVQDQQYAMTYEEFLTKLDEGVHAEWVEGEVTIFTPPKIAHQLVSTFLVGLLSFYARLFDLGKVLAAPCEMLLVPGRIAREPDIMFVARNNLDRLTADRLEGPADLVIELLSDSSVTCDRDRKFYEYEEAGIPEYWVFDPRPGKQRADFYWLSAACKYEAIALDGSGRYHSRILPGFWLKPEWAWHDPQPDYLSLMLEIAPQAIQSLLKGAQRGE